MRKGSNHRTIKRQREVFLKKISMVFVLAVLILAGSIISNGKPVSAHDTSKDTIREYKYYKSIEVTRGDSLWSIAREYMNQDYDSVHDYINELKALNHLQSDKIYDGQHLTVSYHDTEFR